METDSEVQSERNTEEAESCRMQGRRITKIQTEMGTDWGLVGNTEGWAWSQPGLLTTVVSVG